MIAKRIVIAKTFQWVVLKSLRDTKSLRDRGVRLGLHGDD
jgi:hypothetical protein